MIGRPDPAEFGPYYARYIDRVAGDDLLAALRAPGFAAALRAVDPDLAGHAYAPGKWTLAQMAQHVADCEQIFLTRALRIARGDATPQPGFDQDAYALAAPVLPLPALADALDRLRAVTVDVFDGMSEEDARRVGTASGLPLSARAAGWITAGHDRHHLAMLTERYLGTP